MGEKLYFELAKSKRATEDAGHIDIVIRQWPLQAELKKRQATRSSLSRLNRL